MKELLRNPQLAKVAVFLGLGGLGMAGCGTEQQSGHITVLPPDILQAPAFDLCPPHTFQAAEAPSQDRPQALAAAEAENLACFVLEQRSKPSETSSGSFKVGGENRVYVEVQRAPHAAFSKVGGTEYTMSVSAPAARDLTAAGRDPTGINDATLNEVSIRASLGKDYASPVFGYDLAQQPNGWHLTASFDKDGWRRDFNDQVSADNLAEVTALSKMAAQIACFADNDISASQFHPTYVQFNDTLAGSCLPRDHVGTPKTLLPVFDEK